MTLAAIHHPSPSLLMSSIGLAEKFVWVFL